MIDKSYSGDRGGDRRKRGFKKMTTPLTDLRNRPLEQWKVTELKDELKRRSITTKSVKDDLVRRLEEAFRNDGEKANSGSSQQTDSGMNDNNGGGSVNAENPNGNEKTDMFQENQNPNVMLQPFLLLHC